MFKLVIQDDEGKTTVVPLVRDEITIGRKEGNTIRLTERNVSRKHARISRANGAVAIEDLGSYNGVRVNGTRISQRTVLSVSDRVQIGDYLIELKAEGVEQPVPYEDARTQPIERVDPATLAAMVPQHAPPPAAPMALADTDPTARAVAPMPGVGQQQPARLVVLSSNFAGREFQLTKPEMVIGRTDDNDIVVNHRSISRNHAKVVRDGAGGRYTIMDLQSSNGVRVNGEDYGKVELRRGDTVDLGHVRFRFVEAGEDFVFGRDAQIVDVPTKKSKTWLFALIGVAVIGGVIAVVASSGGGGDKKGGEVAGTDPGVAAGTNPGGVAVAPGGVADPGTGPADPVGTGNPENPGAATVDPPVNPGGGSAAISPPSGKPDVEKLLDEARAARDASKWAKASDLANEALKLEPGNAAARTLADQAKAELQNEGRLASFNTAVNRKQYENAVQLYEEIPNDSVYKDKARDAYDRMHTQFSTEMKRQGAALARARKCRDLKRLADDARKVFSDVGDEVEAIACEEAVASVKPPGGGGTPPGGGGTPPGGGSSAKPPGGGGGDPPPSGGGDPMQLTNDASNAAMNGQWGKALSLAEQALKSGASGSTSGKAITVATLAACNLKNEGKAKQYYNKATTSAKPMLRQRCLAVAKFDLGA